MEVMLSMHIAVMHRNTKLSTKTNGVKVEEPLSASPVGASHIGKKKLYNVIVISCLLIFHLFSWLPVFPPFDHGVVFSKKKKNTRSDFEGITVLKFYRKLRLLLPQTPWR
jgi:hypothetical protein